MPEQTADLYLLMSIIGDWPDREAKVILRRWAEAVPPTGRVVILGGAAPDAASVGLAVEMVLLGPPA